MHCDGCDDRMYTGSLVGQNPWSDLRCYVEEGDRVRLGPPASAVVDV